MRDFGSTLRRLARGAPHEAALRAIDKVRNVWSAGRLRAAVFALATAMTGAAHANPEEYNLRYLGGINSVARGVNDDFFTVGWHEVSGIPQPFVWDVASSDGDVTDLPLSSGNLGGRAYAISNRYPAIGQYLIAGEQNPSEPATRATIWTPSGGGYQAVQFLTTQSTARGVDDQGNVVGWQTSESSDAAFIRDQSGVLTELPRGGFTQSRAYAIATNAQGTTYVAGAVYDSSLQIWRAAVWTRLIPGSSFSLAVFTSGNHGYAYGVNRLGHAVGEITLGGETRGFVRTSVSYRVLGHFSTGPTRAFDINDGGRIVGMSQVAGLGVAFYADDNGSTPPLMQVSTDEPLFGYRSGLLDAAYSVCDVDPGARASYIPAIAMQARKNGGGIQAVIARPKIDRGDTGRAIGGVAVHRTMEGYQIIAGQGALLQLITTYSPPTIALNLGDKQAEPIPGKLEFFDARSPSTFTPISLGGSTELDLTIPIGENRFPADPESPTNPPNNLFVSRDDAGKRVQVRSKIALAYREETLTADLTIPALPTSITLPGGFPRHKLGSSISLSVTARDTIFNQGIGGGRLLCELINPVTGARFYLDSSPQSPKVANGSGQATFVGAVPASLGVSQPGNPVRAEITLIGRTSGDTYPYYNLVIANQPLDIYSDTHVAVPPVEALPGETVPVRAMLSEVLTGLPVAGRELIFLRLPSLTEMGRGTTNVNGTAVIHYSVPTGDPLPFFGHIDFLVRFEGDGGANPQYTASEGTGRLSVGRKELTLETFVLGASAATVYDDVPIGASGTWTLQGTFGEPIVGVPDSQADPTARVSNAFWRTVGPLIKRLRWF